MDKETLPGNFIEKTISEVVDTFLGKFSSVKNIFTDPKFLVELGKAIVEGISNPDGRMNEESRTALQIRLLRLQEEFSGV